MIYLDYAANHPACGAALDRFREAELSFPGNPNSDHPAGQAARSELARITASIASMLGAEPEEIIYTSGATEANNTAVKGIARAERHAGRHIISTPLEHSSVSGSLTWLKERGWEIDFVDIRRDGTWDTEHLRELLRPDTVLAALTLVDSELGTVQPLEEVKAILRAYPGCRLHIDAAQAVGRVPVRFEGIDTMSVAPHKFGGLNGSGVLVKRKGLVIEPLLHGGASTTVYRSGTPALALAASLETALREAVEHMNERAAAVARLNARLTEALAARPDARINSPAGAVPHIINLSVKGVKGAVFQRALAEEGVCVSVKSACSADSLPSRAVFAVSRDRKNALSSFRVSLSHLTTEEDITGFLRAFDACRGRLIT